MFNRIFTNKFSILFIMCWSLLVQAQTDSKKIELESALIDVQKELFLGNTDHAIELLENLQHEPAIRAVALYELAKLYKLKQQPDKAVIAMKECNSIEPLNKWYLVYESNILEEYGRFESSAINYEKLVKLEPLNYTFYDQAALNYIKANQIKKSLKILSQAESKFGKTPLIAVRQANILSNAGDDKKAIQALETSLKSFSTNKDLQVLLISLYEKNNMQEKANVLKKNANTTIGTKDVVIENNSPSSSTRVLQNKKLSLDERIKLFLVQLQLNKFTAEDSQRNLQDAEQLTFEFPNENKSWALLADLKFIQQNYTSAFPDYEKAIRLGKVPLSVYENLIYCYDILNKWLSLEKFCNSVLETYPNNAQFYYYLAKSQYEINKMDEALSSVNQALLMLRSPGKNRSKILLLKKMIMLSSTNQDQLEKINAELHSNPKDEETEALNAILECQQEKTITAGLTEKINSSKELTDFKKHFILAKFYFCNHNTTSAIKEIAPYMNNETYAYPDFLYFISELQKANNNPTESKQWLDKAIQKSEYKDKFIQKLKQF